MEENAHIKENLAIVHSEIHSACLAAGRQEQEVRLLLATKTVAPAIIRKAIALGESLIGENKVQEYQQKAAELQDVHCERHFIGHLQTNKIKEILNYVTCIQSVDRTSLAEKLSAQLEVLDRYLDIYIQINTSGEESKSGVKPGEALRLMETIKGLPRLKVKGLMTIGLFSSEEIPVRKSYSLLRDFKDKGQAEGLLPVDTKLELSMGMSSDLGWAIKEGSTMVRVGSAIFGKRNYR
ncbi:YggS family pyridoxal phosphate-dependent enzyme [Arachidicoccus ginsenosidivorans]|jgi:pyridoxal phosphate enzyme (YggS family)